jgi:threonylcarbamoyladenosine tRNA methylthiotransferase MtaB
LYDYLDFLENSGKGIFVSEIDGDDTSPSCGAISSGSRTRAFMKIQDGCNFKCSYCIVPYLRGNSRSREMESCIEEAKLLFDKGYKEIVLTGINIGSYHARAGQNLCDLIEELLSSTEIPRIRISSIEPNLVTDRLLNLIETEDRVCRYLHIPLQHGSDEILRLMHRRYNIDEYRNLVNKIVCKISGIGIGTDVMVGFPNETEKHFNQMYNLLDALPLMYFHVFRFSLRYNTPAAQLSGRVSEFDKKRRANSLRDLSKTKRGKFLERFLNEQAEVLFEQKIDSEYIVGYTDNYIKVKSKANKDLINRIAKVEITGISQENAVGQVIEK